MGKHPNILWIITDQQRAESLSINGCENASTPVLDGLAKTGANFTSAISGFPLCCPYRGSMLTSRYPHSVYRGMNTSFLRNSLQWLPRLMNKDMIRFTLENGI